MDEPSPTNWLWRPYLRGVQPGVQPLRVPALHGGVKGDGVHHQPQENLTFDEREWPALGKGTTQQGSTYTGEVEKNSSRQPARVPLHGHQVCLCSRGKTQRLPADHN